MTRFWRSAFACVLILGNTVARADSIFMVRDGDELRAALRVARPGTTLKLAPGTYPGDHYLSNLDRLTIDAQDPKNPPLFKGGGTAFQFSKCNGLTLRNLRVEGMRNNGINLDDGGELSKPVSGVTLENISVLDTGPTGNHDGIKASGLTGLTLRNCTLEGWGGQGVDMVGCHKSTIIGCAFRGKPGFTATAGVQMKGGSADIVVEKCRFVNAGERPLNIGGSTGLAYFRPPGAKFEAARIEVRNCTIEGSMCAAAFVGVDGAAFTNNTILYPEKWIFRILQETREPGFAPCRNVLIKGNRIVFHRAQVQVEVNIGAGTQPESFRFESNLWYAEDRPDASKPRLPVEEVGGRVGFKPN